MNDVCAEGVEKVIVAEMCECSLREIPFEKNARQRSRYMYRGIVDVNLDFRGVLLSCFAAS